MRKKLILLVTLVLGLTADSLFAQRELQVAAKQFELGIYDEALKSIQNIEKSQALDVRMLVIKALSQHFMGDYFAAVASFTKARSVSPTDYSFSLAYANALIRTGQYEAAKAELSYLPVDNTVSHLMDYCDNGMIHSTQKSSDQLLLSVRNANFGPVNIQNALYYNTYGSPKMDELAQKSIEGQVGFHWVRLEGQNEVTVLKGLGNKVNIGNFTASSDGMIAFTKNQPLCESLSCRMKNSSIFFAKLINGSLEEETSFPYNALGISNVDPYLSNDGKTLHFASNRPGGLGGFDIYVSTLENGKWSEPTNVGPSINTLGDEISPMKYGEKFYFSSNWHIGLGGFDIFSATKEGIKAVDGVNSFGDDYLPKLSNNKMYYTSNRTGKDGIYLHEMMVENEMIAMRSPIAVTAKNQPVASNPFEGARLVSQGYTITSSNVKSYFVQLGAFGVQSKNFDKFSKASKYGDVYKVFAGQAVKIRIGWFNSELEARNVLNQIKKEGFPDAFVVGEVVNTSQVELIYSSGKSVNTMPKSDAKVNSTVAPATDSYSFEKLYKVRLASYEDPIWFDNSKVKDLGKIEQWSKGTWTIFILGGFKTYEEAESARIKATNRGFDKAEVVVDTGGILESLKKN